MGGLTEALRVQHSARRHLRPLSRPLSRPRSSPWAYWERADVVKESRPLAPPLEVLCTYHSAKQPAKGSRRISEPGHPDSGSCLSCWAMIEVVWRLVGTAEAVEDDILVVEAFVILVEVPMARVGSQKAAQYGSLEAELRWEPSLCGNSKVLVPGRRPVGPVVLKGSIISLLSVGQRG